MSVNVVVGTQWGDEGKGKVTDFLSQNADVVVRYQGGNNAGHTIEFDEKKFALHLIPSGIFNKNTANVMASGMVINLEALVDELTYLHENGVCDYQLLISDRAHLVLPYHIELDKYYEKLKGNNKVGTTSKGIGPAYTDKAARFGIRVGDLFTDDLLEKITFNVDLKNKILSSENIVFDAKKIYQDLLKYREIIAEYVCDTTKYLNDQIALNKEILFEGAQGVMLCLDNGTYPYVTSSSPTASSVSLNTGIPFQVIDTVFGVTKAYSTRVGSGTFVTEFEDETAKQIRTVGREFGTTTGRPRRIGWFDTVIVKHARRVGSVNKLAIMLLDVLSGIEELKICVAYELNGKTIDYIPSTIQELEQCKPVYKSYPGFNEDITKVTVYDDLPVNAQKYLEAITLETGIDIGIVSVGPNRLQTMVIDHD